MYIKKQSDLSSILGIGTLVTGISDLLNSGVNRDAQRDLADKSLELAKINSETTKTILIYGGGGLAVMFLMYMIFKD